MANRPGVMFYFEVRPCLKRLSLEEKGALFEAILDYGEFGVVPELDGVAAIAWDFVQPRIDKDGERYEKVVAKKEYAVYCRETKKQGKTPLEYEQWEEWRSRVTHDGELEHLTSYDNGCYPEASSAQSQFIPISQSATPAAAEPESETKITAFRRVNHDPDVDFERKRQEQIEKLTRYCGGG